MVFDRLEASRVNFIVSAGAVKLDLFERLLYKLSSWRNHVGRFVIWWWSCSLSVELIHKDVYGENTEVNFQSRNVLADPELRMAIKDYRYFVFVMSDRWKWTLLVLVVDCSELVDDPYTLFESQGQSQMLWGSPRSNFTYSSMTVQVKLNWLVRFECSKWPTIPQVYVNGEFLGGSDILISMHRVRLQVVRSLNLSIAFEYYAMYVDYSVELKHKMWLTNWYPDLPVRQSGELETLLKDVKKVESWFFPLVSFFWRNLSFGSVM